MVNSVVVPGQVSDVADSRERFEGAGIKFYPQLMRVNGQPAEYGWVDRWRLDRAFGDMVSPSQMNRGYQLKGLCHAGSKYFIIHPKGDAFSCYPGKRFGDGHLGNVFDGDAPPAGTRPPRAATRSAPARCPRTGASSRASAAALVRTRTPSEASNWNPRGTGANCKVPVLPREPA